MDNQISVNWDTISGIFDRTPFLPITLIDTKILDEWFNHPSVWEVLPNLQHSWHVLAMVRYTLPSSYKGQPAIIFGASFVFILANQAWTNLRNALSFLKHTTKDRVILVSTPMKLTYSPQPQKIPHRGTGDVEHHP